MAISFEQVVARIMANWPALQIAVDNSLGGELSREKAKWLVEVTSEFITGTDCVCNADIVDYVSVLMDQEFNTLLEDGSLEIISEELCSAWEKFKKGDLEEFANTSIQNKKDGSLLTDEPNREREEESKDNIHSSNTDDTNEDGWTVVSNKRH